MTAPGQEPWDMPTQAKPPIEPTADQRTAALTMRQIYVALLNEGFTEPQSLHILGVMLAAQIQAGPR